MWEMAGVGENKKIYILGVIHSNAAQKKLIPSQRIADALNQSEIYAMELDSNEGINIAKIAKLPPGDKLSFHLENSVAEQLKEYFRNSNFPKRNPEFIENYNPLAMHFVLLGLSSLTWTKQGLVLIPQQPLLGGMDSALKDLAVKSEKRLAFLESAGDVFGAWNQNCDTKKISTDLISSTLQAIQEKDESEEKYLKLEAYIAKGDLNGFNSYYGKMIEADGLDRIYFDCLVEPRSKRWIGRIEQLLAEHGSILVAVGAGHLYGQSSLVELLKRDGFVVRSSPTMQNSRP